ncbi:MAG: hypothetical protein ACLFPS_06370 [Clostridia bacterium]
MKEKVMVFEVKDNTFIALSESGDFLERPLNKPLEVGDYLFVNTKQDDKVVEFNRSKTINFYPLLKVAAVILIAISLVLVMNDNISVVATIDINPSFEFHLNNEDEIVKAIPLSPQAEDMNKYMEFKGLSYQQGLRDLVEESIDLGYINQAQQNLVIVSMFDKDGKDIDLEKKNVASGIIERISQEKHLDLVVATYDVTQEEYNEAKEIKTSVNKFVASKKASELGIEIHEEDINEKNIKDLAKEQGIAPGLLISEKADINEVQAAPPGLTKKDILPPGHQKKDSESEEDEIENAQNSKPETPPGLNKDKDVGNKPRVSPGKEEHEDEFIEKFQTNKESTTGESIGKENSNKPDDPPGQDKKNEKEEDEEEKEEKEEDEKNLPPGLENKDVPKGHLDDPQEQFESDNNQKEKDRKANNQRKSSPGLENKDNSSKKTNEDDEINNSRGNNRSNSSKNDKRNITN